MSLSKRFNCGHSITRKNSRVTGGHGRKYVKCRLCANKSARLWAAKKAKSLSKGKRKWALLGCLSKGKRKR